MLGTERVAAKVLAKKAGPPLPAGTGNFLTNYLRIAVQSPQRRRVPPFLVTRRFTHETLQRVIRKE